MRRLLAVRAALAALALLAAPFAAPPAAAAPAPASPSQSSPSQTSPFASESTPLPGQSDQPAPPSGTKRVIENVHTDAVSAFVDGGRLALDSKADVDDRLGKRFAADATLFHLGDAGRMSLPAGGGYDFLGAPGDEVWLAPQIQNHAVIWPGFSTEDQALREAMPAGAELAVRLVGAEGPGRVEIFMSSGSGPQRVFSSSERLRDWQIGVPQHTHMGWGFTEPGTYALTFEMEGTVAGARQTARNTYVFVVGDLAAHTAATSVALSSSAVETGPGEPVTLTAEVMAERSGATVGAVQFRDLANDSILGHAPVVDGIAAFRTAGLVPGAHRIVAEFVPTWANDFAPSASGEVALTVRGEAVPQPSEDDALPVSDAELAALPGGEGLRVTAPGKRVRAGGSFAALVADPGLRGDWVSVWLHAPTPVWLGWRQVDLAGAFTATVPERTAAGAHRVVAKGRDGAPIGWDGLTVTGADPGPGGGGGTAPPDPEPAPPTAVAPQSCEPALTLDHGHIDAFTVTAGGGAAALQLMEDVTGHKVKREPETVLLRVKESAYSASIPTGTPGAPSGYVLPLTQDPGLIWPGWDTNGTRLSGYSDVSISITGVSGPGTVHLYTRGAFGDLQPIFTNGSYTAPGTIREASPAHTHAEWNFSQKGVYKLTASAVATNPSTGATLSTAAHTYVFQVGDVPLGDAFCGLSAHGAGTASLVNAAVDQAAAEAAAAEQATAAPEKDKKSRKRTKRAAERERTAAELLDELLSGEAHPAVIAGVVGGGALALAGIVGGTVWYVRRLGAADA